MSHGGSAERVVERRALGVTAQHPIPVALAVPRVAAIVEQQCGTPYWFIGELSSLRPGRGGWVFATVSDGAMRLDLRLSPRTQHNLDSGALGRLIVFRGVLRLDTAGRLSAAALEARSVDAHGVRLLEREDLRHRLRAEGIFTRIRRALPEWPETIAVVTAARGAAVEDFRAVVMRRAPWVRLIVHDAAVQGQGAPESLACAITAAADVGVDVVVVTRGGGAAEDLAAFDHELVVRAVAASTVPLVCAVGHQTDRTLADDVADLSVATPTAAAERITPDRATLVLNLAALRTRLNGASERYRQRKDAELRNAVRRATPAMTRLLQLLGRRLDASGRVVLAQRAQRLVSAHRRVGTEAVARCERSARSAVGLGGAEVHRLRERVRLGMERTLESAITHLRHQRERVVALSPVAVLERGYAVVRSEAGLCRSAEGLERGATVTIHFADGAVTATIESTLLTRKGRAA